METTHYLHGNMGSLFGFRSPSLCLAMQSVLDRHLKVAISLINISKNNNLIYLKGDYREHGVRQIESRSFVDTGTRNRVVWARAP
jgi:hypothetical protein